MYCCKATNTKMEWALTVDGKTQVAAFMNKMSLRRTLRSGLLAAVAVECAHPLQSPVKGS